MHKQIHARVQPCPSTIGTEYSVLFKTCTRFRATDGGGGVYQGVESGN